MINLLKEVMSMFFKDEREMLADAVDSVKEPVRVFDQAIEKNPDLIVPMALIHLVPIVLVINGAVKVVTGHQRLKIEREKTKQVMMRSSIETGHPRHRKFKM